METPDCKPVYGTKNSAGCDLVAHIKEDVIIWPGERKLVPTGISVAIPVGFEGQVRPRSGLALKRGITVLNSPGTIDSDYRGPVGVLLYNSSDEEYTIKPYDRIAQLVITLYMKASWDVVEDQTLNDTERGEGGFGSTGT